MKTALLILQFFALTAMAMLSGYSVGLLLKINSLLAIYSWGISFPVILFYLKTTDKLWFNKEYHHA